MCDGAGRSVEAYLATVYEPRTTRRAIVLYTQRRCALSSSSPLSRTTTYSIQHRRARVQLVQHHLAPAAVLNMAATASCPFLTATSSGVTPFTPAA